MKYETLLLINVLLALSLIFVMAFDLFVVDSIVFKIYGVGVIVFIFVSNIVYEIVRRQNVEKEIVEEYFEK